MTPTKTKNDELAESAKTKALLKALATGDTEGIDTLALQKLMASLGMKVVIGDVSIEKRSRVETQRRWATAKEMTADELAIFSELPKVLGKSPTILSEDEASEKADDFNQGAIDTLMAEELLRRKAADIVGEKGRYQAIRATMLNLATYRDSNKDPFAEATFSSPVNGHKFVVSKVEYGATGEPNYAALESVVDPEVWEAITQPVVVRQVDEEKLAQAIGEGISVTEKVGNKNVQKVLKVTMDEFAVTIPEAREPSRRLNVSRLKEGDAV